MPSALQDRTTVEVILEITLSLVVIWSTYEQTKQIQGRTGSTPSKFWYNTARVSQEIAHYFGKLGIKAENNYYNSLG